jgi:hypothetical protein
MTTVSPAMFLRRVFLSVLCLAMAVQAFVPSHQRAFVASPPSSKMATSSCLSATPFTDASVHVSAATLDPTTMLSDLFSGILGSPIILAIPILAALSVAGIVVYGIVSYASPTEPDDE